uniref:formate C-acetyltransferase n=1 Tax=Mastigamoeba balamuthi TaxID=108607 RepID=A0A1U7EJL0_MASBA|nr:pyruvate formate lyase 1 [Mastigamoeba balamuthi]|eukprot:m51a1_g2379 putative pyruvate formate lyase (771) ;mRNA; f:693169-695880
MSCPIISCAAKGKFERELDGSGCGPFHDTDTAAYIREHVTAYDGDASFLAGPTQRTRELFAEVEHLLHAETEAGGLLDVDVSTPSTITAFPPAYIDKDKETIVGLQTDKPLKRAIKPCGGRRIVEAALKAYGREVDPEVDKIFSQYRKTHNDGVFDAYTDQMRLARKVGILTGLPDGYGRGRIIGDYRRVALYGVDALVAAKKADLKEGLAGAMTEEVIRLREEVAEQIRALEDLKAMAKGYGFDIGRPAADSREAIQWLYFAYLGAVKEQDGAAMSLGRVDAFLDTYIEKDLRSGKLTEEQVQELIDHFVIKLRLVRHLRTPEYNNLFAGDPTWVTLAIGGTYRCPKTGERKHMVTKTSYRLVHTLVNLGPAPEPNITILWAKDLLPEPFKRFCTQISINTSSIQYESDDLMNPIFGADYAIACCVSAMRVGKDMQFFGARANLPKLLLYTLNRGVDEIHNVKVADFPPVKGDAETPLDFEEVKKHYEQNMAWLAELYANTMNVIHYMHDKYNYEKLQMALHDTSVHRFVAFGVSGLSVVADSLSAIKHARVYPVRDPATGIAVDFRIEGDFPKFGNDDPRADDLARWVATTFSSLLQRQRVYRKATPTLSILTITSNVMYGKATGSTPDGRKRGQPFAPGANPMHGRELSGALPSLNSVAQIPYASCMDGISNTFSIVPSTLGKDAPSRTLNLAAMLDGYFALRGFHLNVNVLNRDTLLDAVAHPENYPNLTIRVSGYAVNFVKLTPVQQQEVIARTFHDSMKVPAAH